MYLCILITFTRMRINVLKCVLWLLAVLAFVPVQGQKLITYEAGMGTRDPFDPDVWILYQRVRAVHEGMVLHADSALLNTVRNDFVAFGNIKVEVTDTTTIFGDQLYYDGTTRVVEIWDDTVRMIDGKTILKSDHLTYDRYSSIASYDSWGITTNQQRRLVSKVGYYKAMGLFMAGIEATVGVMQAAVIAFGGLLMMRGELTLVDLLTFTLYVSTFTGPVRKLAQFMEIYTQGTAGFSRFLELMRTEPEITDAPDAVELRDVRGEIRYDHVDFTYQDGTEVLRDINVEIRPGETFALVGSSGGGKTTMCHLLPRFYDVTKGAVTVDGLDVRRVTQRSLHRNIGIIQQDVFMFAGTVMDNIRYGRPDASEEEIIEAAKRAEIHEEIMRMPRGYESYIGEREAEDLHRQSLSEEPAHPDPGRGHLGPGFGDGAEDPGEPGPPERGQDLHRHRPQALHHTERRLHRRCGG